MNLLRKLKKEHSENIKAEIINDNNKFWKIINPLFSNKGLSNNILILTERNNLISGKSVLANTMNQSFTSTKKQRNLKKSTQLKKLDSIIKGTLMQI